MNKPLKFLYDWIAAIANIRGLKWTARPLKLVIYTLEGLLAHGTMDMGAALTFYTLVSIVPVLALAFAVVKGFGLAESLVQNLYSLLPQMPEVVDYMVSFANNTLARTNGGVMATIGLLTLLWAVVNLFESIEANFNKIWEVKSSRNLVRKYSDYITVVIIAPLLWIVATSVGTYTRDMLGIEGVWWLRMASKLFSMILVWAMFAIIYIVLPNTKVENEEINTFSQLPTLFNGGKGKQNLFVDQIVNGYAVENMGDAVEAATYVSEKLGGGRYLELKQDAWVRLQAYYATIGK